MNRFTIATASSFADASAIVKSDRFELPIFKAGGMDVVDHLKEGLWEPDALIDVLGAEGGTAAPIQEHRDTNSVATIRLSALTTLDEIATSTLIQGSCPALSQSAGSAATPQVRNVATAAGNLLQRPRCWYYRSKDFDCLKKGGDRCYAVKGHNGNHAIFGDGPCHIVHPSNIAIALMVAGGVVHVTGGDRETVSIGDLFHMPDRGIRDEHNLDAGEVVTAITLDAAPNSGFYAVKGKQSFGWPLVMVAVALELDGGRIDSARVCAGAVAPVPWMLARVGDALRGVSIEDEAGLKAACARATQGASPMTGNAYKLKLLPVAIRRAVLKAAGKEVE